MITNLQIAFCGLISTSLIFKGLPQSGAKFLYHNESNYFKIIDDFQIDHFCPILETIGMTV